MMLAKQSIKPIYEFDIRTFALICVFFELIDDAA